MGGILHDAQRLEQDAPLIPRSVYRPKRQAHIALAGPAIRAVVGTADRRDDQVASGESRHALPHRLDHAERLMADDQEIGTRRRLAVEAAVDLRVGAVDADLEDAHQRRIPGRRRNRELDLSDAAGPMGVTATARMVAVTVFAIDSIVGSPITESPASQCAAPAGGERIPRRTARPGGILSIGAPAKTPRSCAAGRAAASH